MKKYLALAGVALGLLCTGAQADTWPGKQPVSMIVGFSPGGSTDIVARLVADRLSKKLDDTFVVENRPGANGDLAAVAVKKARPNGYTLLVAPDAIVTSPAVRTTGYDPVADFEPIAMLSRGPLVLVLNPNTQASSVAQLVGLLKSHPGKYSFGSSGVGNNQHFAGEKFKAMTGVSITHIPYKGGGQAIADLVAGQIPMAFLGTGPVMPQLRAGKLKVLAVTTIKRFPGLPEVPTLDESGLKGFDMSQWIALMAPKGTPPEVIRKLNAALDGVLADATIKERFLESGMETQHMSPAEVTAQIKKDLAAYRHLADTLHMRTE
ncbi:Bug family tripartite tricarboxylate transporter substrate binding protein [Candidimonas nitroreducens]|uniref:ABC transporter substrate-binding protein n=1 Tax=Candidimonas nitroreducens TaxID=683354 RepID=A0A225MEZ2_9BURK|nr:tripartite tricarboxylate transporter substrate binding protein [Candidimonas nitroreducens]OWT58151.1 hypothetical protein CEY11_14120 [Candidimonas nitroreducens]